MANLKDENALRLDSVADQVGADEHQFTPSTGDGAASERVALKPITGREKPLSHPPRGQRTIVRDPSIDGLDVGQRPVRPDYLRHEKGVGSGVPAISGPWRFSQWS